MTSSSLLIVRTHLYLSLAEDMAQVGECLLSKCEYLNFMPSTSISPNIPILVSSDTEKPDSVSLFFSLLVVLLHLRLQHVFMAAFSWSCPYLPVFATLYLASFALLQINSFKLLVILFHKAGFPTLSKMFLTSFLFKISMKYHFKMMRQIIYFW